MKIKYLAFAAVMAISSMSMVACSSGEKKPSGTYTNDFYKGGPHKIYVSGKTATLTNVWLGRGAGTQSGTAKVTDWEKYDCGGYYWKAEVSIETEYYGETLDWSQRAYANKNSSKIYLNLYTYKK